VEGRLGGRVVVISANEAGASRHGPRTDASTPPSRGSKFGTSPSRERRLAVNATRGAMCGSVSRFRRLCPSSWLRKDLGWLVITSRPPGRSLEAEPGSCFVHHPTAARHGLAVELPMDEPRDRPSNPGAGRPQPRTGIPKCVRRLAAFRVRPAARWGRTTPSRQKRCGDSREGHLPESPH
jgi:hypothetical protein